MEKIIFGKIKESGFWNNFNFKNNQNSNLNLVEFNAGLYGTLNEFYKEISNFELFIKKCKEEKEEEEKDEENNSYKISLKEYIRKTYIIKYEDIKLSAQMTERDNELLSELQKLIDIKNKDEAYFIIKYYLFMINNKDKCKIYKESNAEIFFMKLKS